MLLEPSTDIESAARFDLADHRQHVGAGHRAHGAFPEDGKDIANKTSENAVGMTLVERRRSVRVPGACGRLESRGSRLFHFCPRVEAVGEQKPRLGAAQPRIEKADLG